MNERDLARGFASLWTDQFPMLSPNFIVAFNETLVQPIGGLPRVPRLRPHGEAGQSPDFVAEFAFRLASLAHAKRVTVAESAMRGEILDAAQEAAWTRMRLARTDFPDASPPLGRDDIHEAVQLGNAYEHFLAQFGSDAAVEFSPQVPGAGVLNACEADLSIGDTLFEVKTVQRKFHSRDIRQLLVYLALQAATGDRRWINAGFLNPRSGVFCHFSVDWLVTRLSGGRPTRIAFLDFVNALSRDSILDQRF